MQYKIKYSDKKPLSNYRPLPTLVITYTTPTSAASGYFVDIDHSEKWDVYGYDSNGTQVVHKTGTALDNADNGGLTKWEFKSAQANVVKVKIMVENTLDGRDFLGFGFDRFSARAPICEP